MFKKKSELQDLIHKDPNLVANGILEISALHNKDNYVPQLISLGKNISLNQMLIDNVFIDAHGILTLVSCQLYGHRDFGQSFYIQTIAFATALKTYFAKTSRDFKDEFNTLLRTSSLKTSFKELIKIISQDPFLKRYEDVSWKKYFQTRLQQNLKEGYFRLVLICAPNMTVSFDKHETENLMRDLSFVEPKEKNYDLVLLDIRKNQNIYQTKMIWRNYVELPDIPIIEKRLTLSLITNKENDGWSVHTTDLWERFSGALLKGKISLRPNVYGYSLRHNSKALYILICITPNTFFLRRDRINPEESIYEAIKSKRLNDILPTFTPEVITQKMHLSLRLYLTEKTTPQQLIKAINIIHG